MKIITDENFTSTVNVDKVSLVDFWAEWCGPCRMLMPIIEELEKELADVNVCKCNVDEASKTASDFGIQSIPTLILFKNGKVIDKKVGGGSKNSIKEWIEKNTK